MYTQLHVVCADIYRDKLNCAQKKLNNLIENSIFATNRKCIEMIIVR